MTRFAHSNDNKQQQQREYSAALIRQMRYQREVGSRRACILQALHPLLSLRRRPRPAQPSFFQADEASEAVWTRANDANPE